ncbi:hypothetical protein [Methylocystis sp. S23]|jgi:hypothetical protein
MALFRLANGGLRIDTLETLMGTVVFQGAPPFLLELRAEPAVETADDDAIILLFSVFAGHLPSFEVQLRIRLTRRQAELLAKQIAKLLH